MEYYLIIQFIYLLIIQINPIQSNIFKQITQNNEIIYIYPSSKNKIYYLTLTSSYKIENNINIPIIEGVFNFTSSTEFIMYDETQELFLASCSKNNVVEMLYINGTLNSSQTYKSDIPNNSTFLCSIKFYDDKILIGYSYHVESNNSIYIKALTYSYLRGSLSYSSSLNKLIKIENYVSLNHKRIIYFFKGTGGNLFFYRDPTGLKIHLRNILIEATQSEFKVATDSINESMVYYFENKIKILYYNSSRNSSHEIETQSTFDFDTFIIDDDIINRNNEIKFVAVYKSNISGHLFIEQFSLIENQFQTEFYYEISNSIGISKIFIKKFSDSLNYFLLLKGENSNEDIYEYFGTDELDDLKQTKLSECITQPEDFLTVSKTNVNIKLSEIPGYNLSLNDQLLIYPNTLKYNLINNDQEIEVIIEEENGKINLNVGFKTTYNIDYDITFVRIKKCELTIQICNEACSVCSEILSSNNSPTKCSPKRCNDGYYYLSSDETECVKITQSCYESCNICSENGSESDHKCTNCKYDYEEYGSFCIKCDKSKKYWYFDPISNSKECLYSDNSCPSDFPLNVENSNECVNSCPSGYYQENNLCVIDSFFYLDENNNNNKVIIGNSGCDNTYSYQIYNTKQCVKNCSNNYYLISTSKLCINQCDIINLILSNNECICDEKKQISIDSNNAISCTLKTKDIDIDFSGCHSLEEVIKLIEEKMDILKLYDDKVLLTLGYQIQVLNSSIIHGLDSNKRIGSIDLKECENILKKQYNLNPILPLIKLLINSPSKTGSLINNLNYYVYSQDGKRLDLSYCQNVMIDVYNVINGDQSVNVNLIEELSEKEINLFDINDEFYQDRCFPFNLNGNDVTTKDRKNDIYPNVSVCDINCTFSEFYEENKTVKCNCQVKTEINEPEPKKETKNFFKSMNNKINYELVECYSVFRNFKRNFYKNLGFYFFTLTFTCIIVSIFGYIFNIKNRLNHQIFSYFNEKKTERNSTINIPNPPKKKREEIRKPIQMKSIDLTFESDNKSNDIKKRTEIRLDSNQTFKNLKIFTFNTKKKDERKKVINNLITPIHIKSSSRNKIHSEQTVLNSNSGTVSNQIEKNETVQTEKSLVSNVNSPFIYKNRKQIVVNSTHVDENKDFLDRIRDKYMNSGDQNVEEEENFWDLPFSKGIYYDENHIFNNILPLLFAKFELISIIFYPEPNTYLIVNITFYFVSLFFDFTLNSLLFSDDIVSKKYSNEGKLSFATEFILSLISNVITNIIMKYLKKLISYSFVFETLKNEVKDINYYNILASYLLKIIHRNIIISFILEIIICCTCGYYLYIFCDVYHKSQVNLLINFVIGLTTSILIVIGVVMLVCLFRLVGVKLKNKNLYYTSRYIKDMI